MLKVKPWMAVLVSGMLEDNLPAASHDEAAIRDDRANVESQAMDGRSGLRDA
ncbi:MAG: hypothetical protein ACREPL_11765 [Rhodanobacteraceae bacterium]